MFDNSWVTLKIGDICDISRGGSPRPIESYIVGAGEAGYPWLRIGDVPKGSRFIFKTSQKIRESGLKKTTLVRKGDFILSNSMSYGRPYIMMTDACIHDGWLALKDIKTELMDKTYLYYLLSSDYMQGQFLSYSAGSGVQNLKKETVADIMFKSPVVDEQRRIVAILESWDEYLEKFDKKIELKKNIKKSLMQHLLTGEVRLPGFADSWQEYKLGEVINVSKGRALSSSGLSSGDIPVIAGGKTSPYSHSGYTHENVITVSASGAYAGYIAYHPYKIWASDCSVVFGKDGRSATEYIYQFLKYNQHKIYTLQSGGAQPHIYPADLKIIKINLPSINEQQAIVGIISTAELEIKKLNEYKKMIESQKKYLVSNLITGKIRTPEGLKIPTKEVQYA